MTTDRKDEAPAPQPVAGRVVDASRRRLVRSGLAGSVVLGSLVSRPVLGQGLPYACTLSGQMSGNASAHQIEGVACPEGFGLQYWLENEWPAPYVKGDLSATGCDAGKSSELSSRTASAAGSATKGTAFGSEVGLAVIFYSASSTGTADGTKTSTSANTTAASVNTWSARNDKKSEKSDGETSCAVSTARSGEAASMLQVLATTEAAPLFQLGRATVVSLLNAQVVQPSYPVSRDRIVAMFNAVKDGGGYTVEGANNVVLSQEGVIQYLEKLYTPAP